MIPKIFWLSYDLGLKGDYEALYEWLDEHNAKECGDSLAVFFKNCFNPTQPDKEIADSLKKRINFQKNDRVYLIWSDDETGKPKGKFIIGRRKNAPWEGFFTDNSESEIFDSQ